MADTPDKQQLSEWKDADNLKRLYSSPEYAAMPGKYKVRYEKHLYDSHIVPNFNASGRKPPTFDQWMQFRSTDKFEQYGSKMYDYFEPRDSTKERLTDYSTRVARSFTGLAESLYNKSLGMVPSYNKTTGKWEHDSSVSNWFANAKAAESKVIDKNSPVEAGLTRKFFESLSDMSSDFPVWNAVSEVTPALGQITKVKEVDRAVVSGLLGKSNLAQELAQSKLGRFAMNRLISAAQVFTVADIQGNQTPIKDALQGSILPQHSNPEIKKFLAEQVNMMGPKATSALLEAAKDLTKSSTDPLTQKLTEGNAAIYNKLARSRGYAMYNVMPKNEKQFVVGVIQSNLKEVLDHPLANASPELQKFLVESHVAKNMTPEMLEGFKASAEVMAKSGQKPSMSGLVQEEVAKAKLNTVEGNPRKAAQEYGPSFRIGRGSDKGQVKVVFPNQDMADLYAYKGRVRRQYENVATKDPLRQQMKDKFGTDIYAKSEQYRKEIHDNIKALEEDSTHHAHSFGESPDRIVPGAASGKSPEFTSNLPKANMRLEGDINKYAYALGHYLEKSPNSPYAKMMLEKLSEALPELSKEELNMLPAALRQHMEDLITTGHTKPDDIRGVFRSTNLNAIFGKGMPTEYQDELADEVEEVGKQKIRRRK